MPYLSKCHLFVPFMLVSLLFVPVSLHAGEKKDDKPPYYLTDEELDKKLGVDKAAKTPEQFVWVVYFHRVPGCDACQLMSRHIHGTIDSRFSDDVKGKKILLRYRNLDEKKNADLAKRLKVKSPSLAIMIVKDGKLVKAKLAGKIWSLSSDKDEFMDYVEKEINSYDKEIQEARK